MVQILGELMSEEAYNTLREEENLGYVATAFATTKENINYLCVLVASGHYDAHTLLERELNFTRVK